MQRLIEQLTDDGEVLEGPVGLGRVHYHLSVYQHFSESGGDPLPTYLEVEGRIAPLGALDLPDLHRRRAELTLRLADGRVLDFSIANHQGTIRSTARGLHAQ